MKTTQFKEKYGQYAVVAGGSDGLGFAFAEAIARRGLNLVLIARREDRLKAAAARLEETYEIDVISVTADMADYENVKKLIGTLKVSIGLLVYNAAFAPIGLFENTSEDHLALAATVNVKAPLLLTKLLSALDDTAKTRRHCADVISCGATRQPEPCGLCGNKII